MVTTEKIKFNNELDHHVLEKAFDYLSQHENQLIDWLKHFGKPVAWRWSHDPYEIWIGESMSHQTTIKQLQSYYINFLTKFPTVEALAKASLEQVQSIWAGLGYPKRAQYLHKSAQICAQQGFQPDWNFWIKLPGVGPYTAAMVLSNAWNLPYSAVDGNILRLYSRLWNLNCQNFSRLHWQKQLNPFFKKFKHPGWVNQSFMEIGNQLCGQKPKCLICPLQKICHSYRLQKWPNMSQKVIKKFEFWCADLFVIHDDEKILLVRWNAKSPFLKNQWSLPARLIQVNRKPNVFHYKHTITNHHIFVRVHKITAKPDNLRNHEIETLWISKNEVSRISPYQLIIKAFSVDTNLPQWVESKDVNFDNPVQSNPDLEQVPFFELFPLASNSLS